MQKAPGKMLFFDHVLLVGSAGRVAAIGEIGNHVGAWKLFDPLN
jgi:hypothetical protein